MNLTDKKCLIKYIALIMVFQIIFIEIIFRKLINFYIFPIKLILYIYPFLTVFYYFYLKNNSRNNKRINFITLLTFIVFGLFLLSYIKDEIFKILVLSFGSFIFCYFSVKGILKIQRSRLKNISCFIAFTIIGVYDYLVMLLLLEPKFLEKIFPF